MQIYRRSPYLMLYLFGSYILYYMPTNIYLMLHIPFWFLYTVLYAH